MTEERAATLGCQANNNMAERSVGYFSEVYNNCGTIDVASASGVGQSRADDYFGRRADARHVCEARKGKHAGAAAVSSARCLRKTELKTLSARSTRRSRRCRHSLWR